MFRLAKIEEAHNNALQPTRGERVSSTAPGTARLLKPAHRSRLNATLCAEEEIIDKNETTANNKIDESKNVKSCIVGWKNE